MRGAAAAAGALLTTRIAHAGEGELVDPLPDDVAEDERAFSLGVAAGDATSSTVLLWTRYDGDAPLRLVVWQRQGTALRQVVAHDLPAGARGPLHVPVDELDSFSEHRYAFYALEGGRAVRRSRVGRFKTAPRHDERVPLRLAATCCTRNGWDQAVLEQAGKRTDLDLLVHLGDTVYADGSVTLADYRKRWWENLGQPGYRALRAATSSLSTWDDHEVDNNWDPETIDEKKLVAAREAFFEHMPLARDPSSPERIWRSRRWGKTLEVFVLDTRSERRRSAHPKQYLSAEQMSWLKRGLKESDSVFKVIVNTVPITKCPPVFGTSRPDRWESYPEERRDILGFIEGNDIPGVLWLAGDFHMAMIARASESGVGSRSLEVLAGPGAQISNLFVPWMFGRQFFWTSGENNVTTLTLDPAKEQVAIAFHDRRGEAFHRAVFRCDRRHGLALVDDDLL